jgi:hypothetical protein
MLKRGALGFVLSLSFLACATEAGEDLDDQGAAASSPSPAPAAVFYDGCIVTDKNHDPWFIMPSVVGKPCRVKVADNLTAQIRAEFRLASCPPPERCTATVRDLMAACERNPLCLRE